MCRSQVTVTVALLIAGVTEAQASLITLINPTALSGSDSVITLDSRSPLTPAVLTSQLVAGTVDRARFTETGIASWYGRQFNRKITASGEPFNMNNLTAAHRSLPLNTVVRVTNLENGQSVLVRVNDRGPYAHGRIIDLSRKAASTLDMKEDGVASVRLEVFVADQAASL